MNGPTILLVGSALAWQQVIGSYRGEDALTFIE